MSVVLAGLLIALLGVSAPDQDLAAGSAASQAVVLAAEQRRGRALVAGDVEALDALLADDLVYTHSNGRVDSKATYLEPLRSGRTRYTSFEPADLSVRLYGATAVILGTATAEAQVATGTSRTHLRFTAIWHRRGEAWQMTVWHATRLPPP